MAEGNALSKAYLLVGWCPVSKILRSAFFDLKVTLLYLEFVF
jgi:hypothetical protein